MIILHDQEPSSTIDLSNTVVEKIDNLVVISGSAILFGEIIEFPTTEFAFENGKKYFINKDGALTDSYDIQNCHAHLAWVYNDELNVINHNV